MPGLKFTMEAQGFGNIAKRMAQASPRVRHVLAVQMAKDTEPYVPARTKNFANRTQVIEDTIIYDGPFAGFLYRGKLMVDPRTGSPFATKGAKKVVTSTDLNISTAVHAKAQSYWFEVSKAVNLEKWKRVAGRAMQHEFRR